MIPPELKTNQPLNWASMLMIPRVNYDGRFLSIDADDPIRVC
jgi:hypothetical protein